MRTSPERLWLYPAFGLNYYYFLIAHSPKPIPPIGFFLALALFNPAAGARRIAVIGFSLALAAALRLQYVPVSFFFVGVFFLCLKSVRQKLFLLLGGALAVLFWGGGGNRPTRLSLCLHD